MANNIVKNYSGGYLADGDRSACIIMITDGIPGVGNNASVANTVANNAIKKAYDSKHSGAYVYTVQMGQNSLSGFDMDKYMDYVSSEFIYAESMTNPGDRNTKDIAYQIDVPTGSTFNIDNLANAVFESVTSNSTNAIATLDSDSILREHLTNAFVIPSDAKTTIQVAKGAYDGLGRLYFKDPTSTSGVTASVDKTNNIIEVKGFNYSDRYVSKSNVADDKGEKLIVTISGVIANADADLVNTSINVTNSTAIYQDKSFMLMGDDENGDNVKDGLAVKQFPTEHFTIPEYTYIMDYDIPMYDSDINGTLCSVDSTLQKQSTYKTVLDTENMGIEFTNGNKDMIYTLNSRGGTTEKLYKGYVLIQRDDGTYDWFRLNIIPASTVYYEETSFETKANTNSKYVAWSQIGSSKERQQLSSPDDVYGNDPAYSKSESKFSLGTHMEATVTSAKNRSETKTFTFTGSGFDLYSACGPDTGIQTVTVKKDGELVRTFIVDTYYNDSTYDTVSQVPIVHFTGERATYTVETTATYMSFAGALKHGTVSTNSVGETELEAQSAPVDEITAKELLAQVGMEELAESEVEIIWMDDNSIFNGGTGVEGSTLSTQAGETVTSLKNYIDGFRIYNPLDDDSAYAPNERNAKFYSVIDEITANSMGGNRLVAYIEPGANGEINFENYLENGGPKHEVYLAKGNSIAFRFKAESTENFRAMISIRAASGSPIVNISGGDRAASFKVKSASETYYDLTAPVDGKTLLGTDSDGCYVVTVTNDSDGLLAVDNIKITNATMVPMNESNLANINENLSAQAVEVNPSVFSVSRTESKYADYTPGKPATTPDAGLDEEGEIPDYVPDSNDSNDATSIIDKLITLFKDLIARIFGFIKTALSAIPFIQF